jgi:hypothetical protein
MENSLILCGGTGAHVGVALLRLHSLGYPLGFFDKGNRAFNFPAIFLVDQDSGDGHEQEPTAWQLVRRLINLHPGRLDWEASTGRKAPPALVKVTPLPIGPNQQWYKPPHSSLGTRFEGSPLLSAMTSEYQQRIDYSKGMMGSPAVGSLLFKLKEYDARDRDINHDEVFDQLFKNPGRLVVAGSGVGGTGASVGPTLASQLANRAGNQVMAVMVLNWFEFEEDEVDDVKRERAQIRNRVMRENSNSALEFYGQSLAHNVAAVPVGMPERSLIRRRFTSDVSQPIQESYIHAVAAQCAVRHYMNDRPYGPGLYIMGAVERGRLDGKTAIPGGTLQSLANQASTVTDLLDAWHHVLSHQHEGRVIPALYEAVESVVEPSLVAEELSKVIGHYREQLDWMQNILSIRGKVNRDFSKEMASRHRLLNRQTRLHLPENVSPEDAALTLFHWTTRWIRDEAKPTNELVIQPGEVEGGQWPDLRNEALNVSARTNGDLTRIPDQDIAAVLEAFVDHKHLAANAWPHPLAAADYFRHALDRRDPVALRQLELLLAGLMAGVFQLKTLNVPAPSDKVSLEHLITEFKREEGFPNLAEIGVFYPDFGGKMIAFNSPHTLLCPVPFMDDSDDNRMWQGIWETLSGADDGAAWSSARSLEPQRWQKNDLLVSQIRSWVEHQKRAQEGRGNSPAWTRVFDLYPADVIQVPFGAGPPVKVYWGSSTSPNRQQVDVSLPTQDTGAIWEPPPGTPVLDESDLLRLVPELEKLRTEDGNEFEKVDFVMPDEPAPVRGFWDEHLNELRRLGRIHIWSRTKAKALIVGTLKDNVLHQTTFSGSYVLDRRTVSVTTCTPFLEVPVPGSSKPVGSVRYPDVPIKGDFLDLVETAEGTHLMELFRAGRNVRSSWSPQLKRDSQDRHLIRWDVHLRGRSVPLPVEIRMEEAPFHKAHWMVWPRFRTASGAGWKAYYVYENCTDVRLFCDVLYLRVSEGTGSLRRRKAEAEKHGPFPVSYKASEDGGRHDGGPPLALSLRSNVTDEESGIYLISLETIGEAGVDLKVGIDFGTSHSVGAFQLEGRDSQQVALLPELDPKHAQKALTHHVCEDGAHVLAPEKELGLLAMATWLPTYRETRSSGFLPSELLLERQLKEAQADDLSQWRPVQDITIPPMDLGRSDAVGFLLTDFKWDAGSEFFKGRERELREHYLGLFLEMVLAEIVLNHTRALPTRPVSMTFTYPLRSKDNQIKTLEVSLRQAVQRGEASSGIPLVLQDNIGMYDESRAAQVASEVFGEVGLVADLGGGTLDLFIAANDAHGKPLAEVADSARLGGNILLEQIAKNASEYLPADGNWYNGSGGYRDTETKLRAWMRRKGAASLFGLEAGDRPSLDELNLYGFQKQSEGAPARTVLNRYFQLIIEYLARNLVAYLFLQWHPNVAKEDHPRLRISVQLRGNGWRLRYEDESYLQATRDVQELVKQRVCQLWELIQDNPYPAPTAPDIWEDVGIYAVDEPKGAPVKNVVGKAESYAQVKSRWYTHTLVDLEVMRETGEREHVNWYAKVPFPTGGSQQVELREIAPSIQLNSPGEDRRVEVQRLEAGLQGDINRSLKQDSVVDKGNYRAPIAPHVWEAVFKSSHFWPHKGGG